MALNRQGMQAVILANGHLTLDGTETVAELRDALMFLFSGHTSENCHRLQYGIPIEELIANTRAIIPDRMRKPRVRNVAIAGERL